MSFRNDYIGPREVQCDGKKPFKNKTNAKRFLRRMPTTVTDPLTGETRTFRRDSMMPYRCPHCRNYHLGHKPKS